VLVPADPHHPLSVMLVLTQLGVGALALEAVLEWQGAGASAARIGIGLAATLLGLGVANLHLGRPQYAFRVVLGLRTSWMSREIVALGAFAGLATGLASCLLLPLALPEVAARLPLASLEPWLAAAAAGVGLLAVFCSVMIYADTHRPLWRFARTAPLFSFCCLALGLGAGCAGTLAGAGDPALAAALAVGSAATVAGKLRFEAGLLAHLAEPEWTPQKRSALLVVGPLRRIARGRAWLGWVCGVALPLVVALGCAAGGAGPLFTALAAAALAGSTLAEWLERQLFFRASAAPAMPGA
jgi:DMSO reductase anchor subunit